MTGLSHSPLQVREFMKRHGLGYLKTGHIPAKADTEKQQQWVKSTLDPAIDQAKEGECQLLFTDAAHFILKPFICALWTVVRMFIKSSSGRTRINVICTVNAITKEVCTFCNSAYINSDTIVESFKRLNTYYAGCP